MTPRHHGERLSLAAFAKLAGVEPDTLRRYINRPLKANPVPKACGSEPVSGQRWWCTHHAQLWIADRPRPRNRKEQ